jgi:hypothetical protein
MTRLISASLFGLLTCSSLSADPKIAPPKEEAEKKIAIGIQYVAIPEANLENYNLSNLKEKSSTGHILSAKQQEALFSCIEKEKGIVVKRFSRLTLHNNQSITIDNLIVQNYLLEVNVADVNGQLAITPKNEFVSLGTELNLQPKFVEDGNLFVNLKFTHIDLESEEIPLTPISTKMKPVNNDGSEGGEITFTQMIQQPKFQTVQSEAMLSIPSTGYSTLFAGTKIRQMRSEFGPPVLSKIPYINRQFKNVGMGKETDFVFAVVKAEVLDPSKQLGMQKPIVIRGTKPEK